MRTIATTALRTARRRSATIGLAIAGAGALLLGTGVGTVPTALAVDTQNITLDNLEAPTEDGENCPDGIHDYWHFIAAPANGTWTFVTITLNLGGDDLFVFTGDDIVVMGDKFDNVFVQVPEGFELGDLQLEGSSADVTPSTGDPKFVLSHLCDGDGPPPTTSTTVVDTTTTTVAETTTTVAETTTTVPETTTTVAETTTTAELDENPPPLNTIDVSSGGPLPTPEPGIELPSTGGSTSITALLGALLLVGGSILTVTARRRTVG
ncbi:MAG TPA: LPXTG cell wall anchor domain-containing protein [Ilumatobacter sp.]|nr:LPXTG cell wall anchor domain-containing protein [Ilumatobacter sp.]